MIDRERYFKLGNDKWVAAPALDGHRAIVARAEDGILFVIAEVWSGGSGIEAASANERLICAAPELFGALAAILSSARAAGDGAFTVLAEAIELARVALALAVEGRP